MKIGVLTYHTAINFGAALQCHALVSHLGSLGHDVEVVNYAPTCATKYYRSSLFRGRQGNWRNVFRLYRFRQYNRRLPVSGPVLTRAEELEALKTRYDLLFVGSDEVWKLQPPQRPYDPSYYLAFADASVTRLASYAASASNRSHMIEMADELRPRLGRMHAVSVRDEHTGAMVKAVTGGTPVEVLDPTFLWDFGPETEKPLVKGDYLALYGWIYDRSQAKALKRFAAARGWKIVAVGCPNRIADRTFVGIGPSEWMRLIRHARYFVTDFFHGVAFAIHFRVPFAVYANPGKAIKIGGLLKHAGLEHRLFPGLRELETSPEALAPVDFDAAAARLAPILETSRRFLRDQVAAVEAVRV